MRQMISRGHLETIPFESFLTTFLYKKSCYNRFPALVVSQLPAHELFLGKKIDVAKLYRLVCSDIGQA